MQNLSSGHQLQAGDLLFFRGGNLLVEGAQVWSNRKHGHYDTTHVAVVTAIHIESDQILIAHMAGPSSPLVIELLSQKDASSLVMFRPTKPAFAAKIIEVIQKAVNDQQAQQKKSFLARYFSFSILQWSVFSGLHAIVNPKTKSSDKISRFSQQTTCSQFVAEALKISALALENQTLDSINSMNCMMTPKDLESYPYGNQNFEMINYVSLESYRLFIKNIENEIGRLAKKAQEDLTNQLKQDKAIQANTAFQKAEEEIRNKSIVEPSKKCIVLAKNLLPIFEKPTGSTLFKPQSYRNLLSDLRTMRIFERDLKLKPKL